MPLFASPILKRLATFLFATLMVGGLAATHTHASAPDSPKTGTNTASTLPLVAAEVRKVDLRAGKITLKHGEIPNLDMPPMTMVFQFSATALPDNLKPGDKVRFRADKVNGAYTVLDLSIDP